MYYGWFNIAKLAILFCLAILNYSWFAIANTSHSDFPLIFHFLLLFYVKRLGQRISQTAIQIVAKFQRSFNPATGGKTSLSFFSPNFASTCSISNGKHSQFSRKLLKQFENCLRVLINVLEFCKKCSKRRFPHNLASIFRWKKRKKCCIYLTLFNRFTSSFHQNERTVAI